MLRRLPRSEDLLHVGMSEHEVDGGGAEGSREPYSGQSPPLNLKRLTAVLLRQLAGGLECLPPQLPMKSDS